MELKDRLHSIVNIDKQKNPKYIENVVKSDFYYLINNYFEVDFDSIKVEIAVVDNCYQINLSCLGDRIKIMRTLPE